MLLPAIDLCFYISEMFAHFEMFQRIENNDLLSLHHFTPKGKAQQTGIFKVSQVKVTLYCSLLHNHGWNERCFFFSLGN